MTIYGKDEIANDLIIDIKQSVLAFPNVNYIKNIKNKIFHNLDIIKEKTK